MHNKIYYLSTCDTCKKILKEITSITNDFELQDIKTAPISAAQLEQIKNQAGSYEALFSKRAQLYKELNLAQKKLNENEYKQYILQHYTFLKRPVVVFNNSIFIGSEKNVLIELYSALKK